MPSVNVPTASIIDLRTEFELAIAWLRGIGVSIGQGRIQYYKAGLEICLDPKLVKDVAAAEAAFPHVSSAAYEISYFLEVYAAFKDMPIADLGPLAAKMEKAVTGPLDLSDEKNESSTARNFLFEAIVAAKFHRPSLGMTALTNPSSDSGFSAGNYTVLVESKRLGSLSQLEKRLKDARDQLNRHLSALPEKCNMGMIALDISRLINPTGMICSAALEAKMDRETATLIDKFFEENRDLIHRILPAKNPRIIAVVIRMSLVARCTDQQKMVVSNQWAGIALRGISPRELLFLEKVFSAVHQMPASTLAK